MGLIDSILNLAGLLLWLNWLAIRFDPLTRPAAATLLGTLRRADSARLRRWAFIGGLIALLLVRAFFYWSMGSALDWTPSLCLVGNVKVFFPVSAASYYMVLMALYSVLSFGKMLAGFYVWLIFLSFLDGRSGQGDPLLRLARAHLGLVARWPWPIRLGLPFVALTVAWLAVAPLLHGLELVPFPVSGAHRYEQAVVVGAGAYLTWKYLIGGLLALHVLNSYVYLGSHPVWSFITAASHNLLRPFRAVPLQCGRVDFAPLAAVAIVFFIAELGGMLLTRLYGVLPL